MSQALCACGCGEPVAAGSHFRRGHNRRVPLAKAGPDAPPQFKPGEEIGSYGTPIFGGLIYDDFNTKFVDFHAAIKIYDEMRRTDGTIQAVLLAMELPLIQTDWFLQAASADPLDIEIAQKLSWNLFESMTIPFKEFLRQALGMHWAGFSVFEKVFEVKTFGRDQFFGLRKMAQRLPQTINRWDFDANGGPRAVWQQQLDGHEERIPIEKLLVFTNRKEGGNIQGISNLRSCYKHWFIKDKLYRLQAIGLERDVVGVPVINLPPRAGTAEKSVAQTVVSRLRRDEDAGIVLPDGWLLKLLESPGRQDMSAGFLPAIQHHDTMIAKATLAQFLNLGESNRGAYALAVPFSDLMTMAEEAQADYVADTITNYALRQLVDINWPGRPAPKLRHGDIRKKDTRQVSLILSALTSAGLLDPDPAVMDWIRNFFGLPNRAAVPVQPGAPDGTPEGVAQDAYRTDYPALAQLGTGGRAPWQAEQDRYLALLGQAALRELERAESDVLDPAARAGIARELALAPGYRALVGGPDREAPDRGAD